MLHLNIIKKEIEMKTLNEIKVTNYTKGIFGQNLSELKDITNGSYNLELIKNEYQLTVNECLFIHVFKKLPTMRNIPVNKQWFENNIYHF